MTSDAPSSSEQDVIGEGRTLLAPDAHLKVPVPAYRGRSLPNLAVTLLHALAPPTHEALPLAALESDLDPLHGRSPEGPVVILLIDGLGWTALGESAARIPNGTASYWLRRARPITSVFPTTTTVALTSLSTGAAPGQHGVAGHRVYLPRFGTVVELLRMSPLGVSAPETLVGPGWSPALVSGVPTIFRRGVPATALTRDRFEGSGFTRLLYDGAEFVSFATGSDLALTLSEVLSRSEPPPLVLVYWDDLDVAEHVRGPLPGLVDLELERMGSTVSYVSAHVPPRIADRTTIVVTGDHGQVPLALGRQLIADQDAPLLALLSRPPSGDRRATFFSARPGQFGALRDALRERLPPGGVLLEMADAREHGLFGPPPWHPELADRLGDFLVLMPSPGGVNYTVPGSRPRSHPMLGAHGGLEPAELLIPLVSGSLAELAPPFFSDLSFTRAQSGR